MKECNYFILIFFLLLSDLCISQKRGITPEEEGNIHLFNEFTNYLAGTIHKKEDINDTAHLKYVVLHYLFTNKQPDSIEGAALNNLKKELNAFYNFLRQHEKDHLSGNLTLMPIRLSIDTFIYKRLTKFQKENTYIFCDKRFPNKVIGYVLFTPSLKNSFETPKIWSWTLIFKFGKYMFKSVTGEEGYEYIFSPEQFPG